MKQSIDINNADILIINKLQKGDVIDKKTLFLFELLLLNKDFKPLVNKIRKKLLTSTTPKKSKKKNDEKYTSDMEWLDDERLTTKQNRVKDNEVNNLIKIFLEDNILFFEIKKRLSHYIETHWLSEMIYQYILFNDIKEIHIGHIQIADTDLEPDIELSFPPTATIDEMVAFIYKNQETIYRLQSISLEKYSLQRKMNTRQRLRPPSKFIMNVKIYNKYLELKNKPKSERKSNYVDLEIMNLLKGEGILLSDGTIRSIISRMERLVKVLNRL